MLATQYITEKEDMGDAVLRWLKDVYQEERADQINKALLSKVPGKFRWLKPILGWILDAMTPEMLLDGLRMGLASIGMAKSARQLHPMNPINVKHEPDATTS